MAKATATIRESLNYHAPHADSFAANQALFNRVVAFYFEVIQAHEGILDLKNKEGLTALEWALREAMAAGLLPGVTPGALEVPIRQALDRAALYGDTNAVPYPPEPEPAVPFCVMTLPHARTFRLPPLNSTPSSV